MTGNQETIHLLEKEYTVACPETERDGLRESARRLDAKMREIRGSGKVLGSERIVVMAALNVIHELLQERENSSGSSREMDLRLKLIQEKIDSVLEQEDRQLTI
ncbi:MAG: cell division protein ZapA [Chromatiales bacterium]|nr:cell division protein ZapA [Chromatiales bacterium]